MMCREVQNVDPALEQELKMNLVEQIVELAKEIEAEDPIDFGMLNVSEDVAYSIMASGVLDSYLMNDPEDRDLILMATVTKLIVENFVLNLEKAKRNE
jgi:hypothetical protein